MLYYIIPLVILFVFLVYQYVTFIRIYYIGQSLHKFRELRTEVTLFLSDNVKNGISLEEAIEYQKFLITLNVIIRNFDTFKAELTKFKSVRTIFSNVLIPSQKLATQSENNTILFQYKSKITDGVLTSFKAIPFYKTRLFIFFYRIVATLAFMLGFDKYIKRLHQIEKFYKSEKEIFNNTAMPCNH
jgi:hypothetical protein